jgi:hypothetical protein
LVSILFSIAVSYILLSALLAIWGWVCLWSILELHEQEKRVSRGWFPRNPKRTDARDILDDKAAKGNI